MNRVVFMPIFWEKLIQFLVLHYKDKDIECFIVVFNIINIIEAEAPTYFKKNKCIWFKPLTMLKQHKYQMNISFSYYNPTW